MHRLVSLHVKLFLELWGRNRLGRGSNCGSSLEVEHLTRYARFLDMIPNTGRKRSREERKERRGGGSSVYNLVIDPINDWSRSCYTVICSYIESRVLM